MELPDVDRCYDAMLRRDARFDGWFFVGVTTTRVYCRPSCPTPVHPKRSNVRIFPTAAAAQVEGFRTCKRCRPDTTPGSPLWDRRGDLLGRAVRGIADGVVDREGVPGLARRIGVSTRHLGRVLQDELGASPLALARAHRSHTARTLLETTDLPITDVAFAAGFGSVRQFNETVQGVFGCAPTELRRRYRPGCGVGGGVALRLPFRRPIAASDLLANVASHAVPSVESISGGTYSFALDLPGGPGVVQVTPSGEEIVARVRLSRVADLATAVSRCRVRLDLDADPAGIDGWLGEDPLLAPLVARRPGLRCPGSADGFAGVVGVIVGQQVSVATARAVLGRIAREHGQPLPTEVAPDGCTHAFPSAAALSRCRVGQLPLPRRRAETVVAVARAVEEGRLSLGPAADPGEALAVLAALPGIGPWTVAVVQRSVLRDPDVVPLTDLVVRRLAAELGITDLAAHAERWAPYRSYATEHLLAVARERG